MKGNYTKIGIIFIIFTLIIICQVQNDWGNREKSQTAREEFLVGIVKFINDIDLQKCKLTKKVAISSENTIRNIGLN